MSPTPIANMVREMIARGVDPDVIALAVGTAETIARADIPQNSADVSADKRRARDRERKAEIRRFRQISAEIPQTENTPLTYEESKEEKIKEVRAAPNRGTRMSADWQPSADEWRDAASAIGDDRARAELLKFRDYWIALPGAKGLKLDWPATWRNWIRRVSENTGGANGQRFNADRNNPTAGGQQSGSAAIVAGVAAAAERRARERSAGGQQHKQPPRDDRVATGTDLELFRSPTGRGPY